MVSRIGGSFHQPSSFNRYEKKNKNQDDESESQKRNKQYVTKESDDNHEEVPILYASTLLNITDPSIENLSPEAKIKHTFTENKHSEKQIKAIESLMSPFSELPSPTKKRDIASMIFAATKQLTSYPVQNVLCGALETLLKQDDKEITIKGYLGFINILENNASAARLLKNKAIYLDTVQELNKAQRKLFQQLATHLSILKKNTHLLKELIRVMKTTIYLGNETTQIKGLLLIHELAKTFEPNETQKDFTTFLLTSMEELKHLMKQKAVFKPLKKAFEQDIIALSEHL